MDPRPVAGLAAGLLSGVEQVGVGVDRGERDLGIESVEADDAVATLDEASGPPSVVLAGDDLDPQRLAVDEQDRAQRSMRDHMNIIEALEARDRSKGGPTAPPDGLYFTDVVY